MPTALSLESVQSLGPAGGSAIAELKSERRAEQPEAPRQVASPGASEAEGSDPREQGQLQPQNTPGNGGVHGGEVDSTRAAGVGSARDGYEYSWPQHLTIHRGVDEHELSYQPGDLQRFLEEARQMRVSPTRAAHRATGAERDGETARAAAVAAAAAAAEVATVGAPAETSAATAAVVGVGGSARDSDSDSDSDSQQQPGQDQVRPRLTLCLCLCLSLSVSLAAPPSL